MRVFLRRSIALLSMSLLLLCPGHFIQTAVAQNAVGQNAASAESGYAVPVRTVAVIQEAVRKTTVQPATIHPFYVAAIKARVNGYVAEVNADIGDVVSAGDSLAVIDVPEIALQRVKAIAALEQQKAEEERAIAGIQLAEARVVAAEATAKETQARMQQVEASLAAAESEFRRTQDLVNRSAIQPRVLDEVREKRDSAAAGKQAVVAAIQSANAAVNVAKSQLVAATADAKVAAAMTRISETQVAEADQLISFATLQAPFDGVVTLRNVSPGDLVAKSNEGESLFVISQLHKVRIHIPVPEKDAVFVDKGDHVSLSFPSFTEEAVMTATVTRTNGSLDPSTRTMLVEVEADNNDGRLLPGMFGQAVITLSMQQAANMLPARAVRFTETGDAFVYVVNENEVSVVSVTTGRDDGNRIEIVSGLQAGQTVVDAHIQRLKDGQKIRVVN